MSRMEMSRGNESCHTWTCVMSHLGLNKRARGHCVALVGCLDESVMSHV